MKDLDQAVTDYSLKLAELENDNKYEPLTSQQIVMNRTIAACYKEFITTLQEIKSLRKTDEALENQISS